MSTPQPPVPVVPWPLRPPRRIAGVPVGLLVCWQAAMLLALVAIGRPTGHVIALGIAAAAVIAVTGTRAGGRWTHEWVLLWLRYLRRKLRAGGPHQEPALVVLELAAGTVTVAEVEIDGQPVAVVSHPYGCTAVLEIDPANLAPGAPGGPGAPPALVPVALAPLALAPLALAPAAEQEAPAVTVQLVGHAVPAAPTRAWLAVQARREAGHTAEELQGTLVSAVRRLQRRLRADRLPAHPLDRPTLVATLHCLTGLDLVAGPAPGGSGPAAPPIGVEQWRTWWTGGLPQASLAIRAWPELPGPPTVALFDALLGPACPRTVSLAARRLRPAAAYGTVRSGEEMLAVELIVRLVERDRPALEAAVRQLRDRVVATGASVERLDGRQLPGLAAILPLGGFLPGYPPAASAHAPLPRRPRAAPVAPHPGTVTAPRPPGLADVDTRQLPAIPAIPVPVPPVPTLPVPALPAPAPPVPTPAAPAAPAPAANQPVPIRGLARVAPGPLPPAPDPHQALRSYQAGLSIIESTRPDPAEQLVALARTRHPSPQVITVVSGRPGLGASTTAAGVARTLITLREDQVALLRAGVIPADAAAIHELSSTHGFVVVDVGAQANEAVAQALALSSRVLVVTGADRHATEPTQLTLARIHEVHPALAASAVMAVVCRTNRQYREVTRGLVGDGSPQADRIIPVPPDPALRRPDQLDLTRLGPPARYAYLRLAATLASPAPTSLAPAPAAPAAPAAPVQAPAAGQPFLDHAHLRP